MRRSALLAVARAVVLGTILLGCSGTLPPAPAPMSWASGKPIYIDLNSTVGMTQDMPDLLSTEFLALGFVQVPAPDRTTPVIKVTYVWAGTVKAVLEVNGRPLESYSVNTRDCGTIAGTHTKQCQARGLAIEVARSARFKTAVLAAPAEAGPPGAPPAAAPPSGAPPAVAPPAAKTPSAVASEALVAGSPQPTAYAVIIGIERYDGLPAPTGARADAMRFADLARRSLGVAEAHLRVTIDEKATKASIERNIEWVRSSVPPGGRVYFYYSGHGAPDASAGTSYILPFDGDPKFLKQTAIPIAEILKQLGDSKAKEVLAVLDSCFSGAGGRSVLPPGARPLVRVKEDTVRGQIAVFSAASGPETSGPTADGSGGLFTHYVVQGLGMGAADGDGDGQVSLGELSDWVKPRVSREAKKDNRDQTPNLVVGNGLGAASNFLVAWGMPTR